MTDIFTLDLYYQNTPETIAAYLVMGPEGPLLIETGPGSTLANLKAALLSHGLTPADIQHVLVTHIHLDHAGAAGWWAQQGATVYVHTIGAPHLINPSKLIASATRIYGQQMDTLWGQIWPAPAEKVVALTDQTQLQIAGLHLTAVDTPGHAWHHMTYRLDDVAFTGDATGNRLNNRPLIHLPAPPPEFHLEEWLATIQKIEDLQARVIYPTHFGRIDDVAGHLDMLRHTLVSTAHFIRDRMATGATRDEILPEYEAWNRQLAEEAGLSPAEIKQYIISNPLHMSVDGIMRYWRKQGIGQ